MIKVFWLDSFVAISSSSWPTDIFIITYWAFKNNLLALWFPQESDLCPLIVKNHLVVWWHLQESHVWPFKSEKQSFDLMIPLRITHWAFNPFTVPARHTCRHYIFHCYNIYFQCCVLMKILSHDSVKKKTETLKGFKFALLLGIFKWHHGSDGVNSEKISLGLMIPSHWAFKSRQHSHDSLLSSPAVMAWM